MSYSFALTGLTRHRRLTRQLGPLRTLFLLPSRPVRLLYHRLPFRCVHRSTPRPFCTNLVQGNAGSLRIQTTEHEVTTRQIWHSGTALTSLMLVATRCAASIFFSSPRTRRNSKNRALTLVFLALFLNLLRVWNSRCRRSVNDFYWRRNNISCASYQKWKNWDFFSIQFSEK